MSLTDRIKAGPPTHKHQHGGWQTQARRRGEEWVGCNSYGDGPAYRDEPETFADFAKAFVAFAFLIGTFIVYVYVMAAAS